MIKSDTLIVAGCMRSGTTILESLICTTEATNPVIHECDFIIELAALYRRNKEAFAERSLGEYFGSDAQFDQYMREMVTRFLDIARMRYHPAVSLVLKNPELTPLLPALHQLRPDARLFVSIRDPRDTIASMVEVAARLSKRGQKLYVVGDGRDIAAAARYFSAVYAPVLAARDANPIFADALLLVRYEDLCSAPLTVAAAIERHSGLSLDGYDPEGDWRRTSIADTTEWSTPLWGKRVSADSIGRFRQVLSSDEIAIIEDTCAEFMLQFGYRPDGTADRPKDLP
jgi:hypothetical protein